MPEPYEKFCSEILKAHMEQHKHLHGSKLPLDVMAVGNRKPKTFQARVFTKMKSYAP